MKRRNIIFGSVAAASAVAGASFAWWKNGPGSVDAQRDAAFWALSFETPQGPPLSMQSLKGKPLLINFWATWCPPCMEELPLLESFYQQNMPKSWQVIGLAVDQPTAVKTFMNQKTVSFPVGLAGLDGTELSANLGNTSGGLPFSVVFGADGRLQHRKMGRLGPDDLKQWLASA